MMNKKQMAFLPLDLGRVWEVDITQKTIQIVVKVEISIWRKTAFAIFRYAWWLTQRSLQNLFYSKWDVWGPLPVPSVISRIISGHITLVFHDAGGCSSGANFSVLPVVWLSQSVSPRYHWCVTTKVDLLFADSQKGTVASVWFPLVLLELVWLNSISPFQKISL